MNEETAVTQTRPFCEVDGVVVFSVNPGVPVDVALEQAAILMECTKHLVVTRGTTNADTLAATLQYLNEMAKALVEATRHATR